MYSTSSPLGYSPLGYRRESFTRGGSDCLVGLAPPAFLDFFLRLRFFFAAPSAPPSPATLSSSSSPESSSSAALQLVSVFEAAADPFVVELPLTAAC